MLEENEVHKNSYYSYWMIIDCIMMLTTQGYNYMTQILRIQGEILKNVYTLSFLQKKKLTSLED